MRSSLFVLLLLIPFCPFAQDTSVNKEIERIEQLTSPKDRASEYNRATKHAWRKGKLKEALEYSKRGLKTAKRYGFKSLESKLHNNTGITYDFLSQYPSALEHYFAALSIQEKLDDPKTKADILGNIGLIYMNQQLSEKSLDYHNQALTIQESINNLQGISVALNNIAIIYQRQKRFEEAIKNYKKCIEIDTKAKDTMGLGDDYNNIALVYMDMEQYTIALDYLEKALNIRIQANDHRQISITYTNFGEIYNQQKDYEKAREYLFLSIDHAKRVNERESLKYAYNLLRKNEEQAGDSIAAFNYYKLYIAYRDSIDNTENARKQTELELNYAFNKEKEVSRLREQQKDRQYKIILIAVSSGLLLILFFSILFFRKWRQTQAQQVIIQEKNELVQQKNDEILASINCAKRIQKAILPAATTLDLAFPNNFVLYLPKDIVSGDFYWMSELNETLLIAVADCTGHGVPGALMSVVCHNALNRAVHEFNQTEPAKILDKTRELVIEELSQDEDAVADGMDISLCAFDPYSNVLKWSGAHNPLWIWRKEKNEIEEIKADKQPIGNHHQPTPFLEHLVEITNGDRIFLFSDGFQDQFGGAKQKKMMRKGFRRLLLSSMNLPLDDQRKFLLTSFTGWKEGLEQVDDVCIVGIECVSESEGRRRFYQ